MTKRELVYSAIAHKANRYTPQAINLTGEGYKAYGERLLEDYPNAQARADLKEGRITFEQAVSLSIGNNVQMCIRDSLNSMQHLHRYAA